MNEKSELRPATEADILFTLSFALKHRGKRAFRNADTLMAEITAAHLLEHLEASGYVLMKRSSTGSKSAPCTYGEHAEASAPPEAESLLRSD